MDEIHRSITIDGESWSDNAPATYKPVFSFIEELCNHSNEKITINFYLDYYNSSTSKVFIELIIFLNDLFSKGYDIKIVWHIHNNDSELETEAEDLLYDALFSYEIKK